MKDRACERRSLGRLNSVSCLAKGFDGTGRGTDVARYAIGSSATDIERPCRAHRPGSSEHQALLELADRAEAIEGIRRGLESMARGEGRPAEQVLEEMRKKHKIPRRT
jgi:hypothetical protein